MRVIVDTAAWSDLNDIGGWIAKDDPQAARRVLRLILQTAAQLELFPRLARRGRTPGTWERLVPGTPYIIVLELPENLPAIIVTAVVHGARDR